MAKSNEKRPDIRETIISNMIYYVGHLADLKDGEPPWNTGPCESPAIASQRLELYSRGYQVSEAAPQQASRRQIEALDLWLSRHARPSEAPIERSLSSAALESGPLSPEWTLVSVLFIARCAELPINVVNAGGTRIRRGPRGPILIDAAGQSSLSRGA